MTSYDMNDTLTKCELCGNEFIGDGYEWLCQTCRTPHRDCECGSDDIILDWEIPLDQNGDITDKPMWRAECQMCERTTAFFETAKEANEAWMNGYAEKVMQ